MKNAKSLDFFGKSSIERKSLNSIVGGTIAKTNLLNGTSCSDTYDDSSRLSNGSWPASDTTTSGCK